MSFLIAAAVAAQAAAPITVEIGNVRNARGKVLVAVCTQAQFLKTDCNYNAEVAAQPGTVRVTIPNVPPGTWAIQAFHDENNNESTDQGLFGIPKEGVGFSRDARISFGPPKWRDAQFIHQGRPEVMRFRLRYMMGPSGPPAPRGK
ncbi:MAG: DUF2141 domain-containing protein [Novosphingobium sp.]